MDIIRRYSKRVLAFYSGKIIADGGPKRVLEQKPCKFIVGKVMLKVDNVFVSIANIKILSNISLNVKKFTSIIGRNGAGKTTLIKSIMKI